MAAPATVRPLASSFCWVTLENVVGMTAGSERLSRDKDGEGVGRTEGAQDKKREWVRGVRRVRGVRGDKGAGRCEQFLRSPRGSSLPPCCSCLSLAGSSLTTVPLEFLHSAPSWRRSDNGAASAEAYAEARSQRTGRDEFQLLSFFAVKAEARTRCDEQSDAQRRRERRSRGIMTAFCNDGSHRTQMDTKREMERQTKEERERAFLGSVFTSPPPPVLC